MKILLDENLPMRLVRALRALGHDVEHIYSKDLSGKPDHDVRALAYAEDRFLITQDRRFADARVFPLGTHPGILLVRMKSPGRRALYAKIRALFAAEDVESWRGCFAVVSDAKLRVRRPK